MTRQELREQILLQTNDAFDTPVFWEAADLHAGIEEAREIVAEEVRALRRTVFVPKREGTQFYDLGLVAPDCMAPFRVWNHPLQQRLEAVSMRQLDGVRFRWWEVTSNWPQCWFPVSFGRFGVYPATASGEGLLQTDYLSWPTPLLDDGDEPEEPEPDQDGYILYNVYLGLLGQWDVPRATERFVKFVENWTDARARSEIERMHAKHWQRQKGD
jgi:hypothetical protein